MMHTPQCTCASFFTVQGKHKPDCPLSPKVNASTLSDSTLREVLAEVGKDEEIDNFKFVGTSYEVIDVQRAMGRNTEKSRIRAIITKRLEK